MDVARPLVLATVSLSWLPISVVQRVQTVPPDIPPAGHVARAGAQRDVSRTVPRQYHHYHHGDPAETQGTPCQVPIVRVRKGNLSRTNNW